MSLTETVIEGTIQPDGTLVLDEQPKLSPGRVTVVLRQETDAKTPQPLGGEFFRVMEEIRADQRARGHVSRNTEEVMAERKKLRDEMDEEIEAAIQLQEECRRRRIQADGGTATS